MGRKRPIFLCFVKTSTSPMFANGFKRNFLGNIIHTFPNALTQEPDFWFCPYTAHFLLFIVEFDIFYKHSRLVTKRLAQALDQPSSVFWSIWVIWRRWLSQRDFSLVEVTLDSWREDSKLVTLHAVARINFLFEDLLGKQKFYFSAHRSVLWLVIVSPLVLTLLFDFSLA